MKVAIYSPYLDTFGGGERYVATIAETLSFEHHVDLLLDKHLTELGADFLKSNLSGRFNLNLEKVRLIPSSIGEGSLFLSRLFFLRKYDLLFYLTDGSIFYPSAKKNILHIQSPLKGEPAMTWWGRLKLKKWDAIIYNSKFTRNHSLMNWPLYSKIIYPPVDTKIIKPLTKKKYILSVGRFFGYLKDKKHELMINWFENLKKNPKSLGWSLHLAGSASEGDMGYLKDLQKKARDLGIKFYPNIGFKELVKLYGVSSVYWQTKGFGEEEATKMEHFGISVAEAMAGGCVPVVAGKGGLREIVDDGVCGYLWDDQDDLISKTLQVMSDRSLWNKMSRESVKKADRFSKENFSDNIKKLIKTI